MITFATLFIGLAVGPHVCEVTVGPEVAAVELRLGDRRVARIDGSPWSAEIDFGPDLVPQRLEAVAFGSSGRELGRVHQWLNMPKDPAVSRLFLDRSAASPAAGLTWESPAGAEPLAVRLTFDGQPLSVDAPRRFPLPPHDLRQLHFLRAELDFADNITSVAELTFGGTFAERVSTELTAVPIASQKKKPPKLESLRRAFSANDRALEVVAIERGTPEIAMVVDGDFPSRFVKIWREQAKNLGGYATRSLSTGALKRHQRLRFVYPFAEPREGVRGSYQLFPSSPEYGATDGGLYPLLPYMRSPPRRPASGRRGSGRRPDCRRPSPPAGGGPGVEREPRRRQRARDRAGTRLPGGDPGPPGGLVPGQGGAVEAGGLGRHGQRRDRQQDGHRSARCWTAARPAVDRLDRRHPSA